MSMMRFPDEEALQAFLKRSHVRVVRGPYHERSGPVAKPKAPPQPDKPKPAKAPKGPKKARSPAEEHLALALQAAGLTPVRQHRYLLDRKFAADFAWPDIKVALEVDGAVHRIKGTFKASFERAYLLTMDGWTVLHVGREQVMDGTALEWINNLLDAKRKGTL